MEEILKLDPIMKVGGSVDLPGSKSISNRALLLAALSEGTTELNNLLVAEDTEMMIGALETLGVKLEVSNDGTEVLTIPSPFPSVSNPGCWGLEASPD